MTRDEVIEHLCETVALVYRTRDNYNKPSDGFCHKCKIFGFQHSGLTLDYVRRAVIKQLVADGYTPNLTIFARMGR